MKLGMQGSWVRGERGTLILNYLGKGKERLRIGEKESFQAQCMRDYWSPLLPKLILPEVVLEHWK
jgi:hypothetical protein